MDKPADPATPFGEVYQSFLDDLVLEGTEPSTINRDRTTWRGSSLRCNGVDRRKIATRR